MSKDYGIADFNSGSLLITQSDLIRQLWLDNNFYGSINILGSTAGLTLNDTSGTAAGSILFLNKPNVIGIGFLFKIYLDNIDFCVKFLS